MTDVHEAQERDEPGFPAPTEPVSPVPPEADDDEYKYITQAREKYLATGRPPAGFGVRVYGDNIIIRRLDGRRER